MRLFLIRRHVVNSWTLLYRNTFAVFGIRMHGEMFLTGLLFNSLARTISLALIRRDPRFRLIENTLLEVHEVLSRYFSFRLSCDVTFAYSLVRISLWRERADGIVRCNSNVRREMNTFFLRLSTNILSDPTFARVAVLKVWKGTGYILEFDRNFWNWIETLGYMSISIEIETKIKK